MKSYYRYDPSKIVGVISTPKSNAIYDYRFVSLSIKSFMKLICIFCSGNLCISGGLQDVNVWNIRQLSQVCDFLG